MAKKEKQSRKGQVEGVAEAGLISIKSPDIKRDRQGRLVEEPSAVAMTARLGDSLLRVPGMNPLSTEVIQTLGTEGAYQIEIVLSSDGQVDVETNTGRPLCNWQFKYVKSVQMVRDYVAGRLKKHPTELGLTKEWIGILSATAGAAEMGFEIELTIKGDGSTLPMPTLTLEELNALRVVKEKDGLVNGRVCGVGCLLPGHVTLWIVGQKDPLHVPGANDDELHAMRKQGVLVKGSANYEEGKWILVNPDLVLVGTQGDLIDDG